jgi:predicted enzyme related to lactoylglutathione lyase
MNQGNDTSSRVTNTIDVSSVDDFSKKISTQGGKVVQPKMAIPGIGYLAICEDTEGISFGIIQNDRNAR